MINMKDNIRNFIGRNLARFKLGKDYIASISFMITALSTMAIFLKLSINIYVCSFPIIIIIGWFLGYIVDKKGILSSERKSLNLANLEVQLIIWKEIMEKSINPILKETIKELLSELKEK